MIKQKREGTKKMKVRKQGQADSLPFFISALLPK